MLINIKEELVSQLRSITPIKNEPEKKCRNCLSGGKKALYLFDCAVNSKYTTQAVNNSKKLVIKID